ncbi:AAA family ATPase, partial [Sphingobacterium paramultivorum]|uniref:AAA family ATPase n=1 Tax=Sphingobacterium paramultivorum TaxID=2886510 RepID=UPI001D0DB9E9
PKQAERRERDLRDLMRKGKRPIVLVVDEAHDLHHKTLTGLKRLMEVVADAGVLLSVLLVVHPRLRNDLRRPQMEEIGYRTTTFDYEGIGSARRDYVAWLLGACAAEGVKVADLMDEDAIDLIAERLRTPLQIEMHLTLAFEQGFRLGAKPVTALAWESFGEGWVTDAVKQLKIDPTVLRADYGQLPDLNAVDWSNDVLFTWNGTTSG